MEKVWSTLVEAALSANPNWLGLGALLLVWIVVIFGRVLLRLKSFKFLVEYTAKDR
jgi:hypothetical protein